MKTEWFFGKLVRKEGKWMFLTKVFMWVNFEGT